MYPKVDYGKNDVEQHMAKKTMSENVHFFVSVKVPRAERRSSYGETQSKNTQGHSPPPRSGPRQAAESYNSRARNPVGISRGQQRMETYRALAFSARI